MLLRICVYYQLSTSKYTTIEGALQSFSGFYNTKVPGIRMGVFVHVDTGRKFFHEWPGFAFPAGGAPGGKGSRPRKGIHKLFTENAKFPLAFLT